MPSGPRRRGQRYARRPAGYEAAKAALEHQAEGDAKHPHLEAQLDTVEDEDGVKDIPSFRAIFGEVHDHFNQRFHAAFEAEAAASAEGAGSTTCPAAATGTDDGLFAVDPFVAQGCGDYMIARARRGPLGDVPAAQLTCDASDVWAGVGNVGASTATTTTELPAFAPPLDDAPAEAAPATADTPDGTDTDTPPSPQQPRHARPPDDHRRLGARCLPDDVDAAHAHRRLWYGDGRPGSSPADRLPPELRAARLRQAQDVAGVAPPQPP